MVYQARSLLFRINGLPLVYDDDDCLNTSPSTYRTSSGNIEVQQAYSLYPNPNNGSFVIARNEGTALQDNGKQANETVPAKVYDGLGRQILKTQLTFVNGKANIQMAHPFPGQYMICLEGTCIKFTIK